MTSKMDDSWRNWTRENLEHNCDPREILGKLLQNRFSWEEIAQAMGEYFARVVPPALAMPWNSGGTDYKSLSETPLLWLGKLPGAQTIVNDKLQLIAIEHFLSDAECDDLIKLALPTLRPSTVTVYAEGFRTSSTADLGLLKHPLVEATERKISQALGINLSYSESIQIQKYKVGEEFKPHTDYFEPYTDEYRDHASHIGNRTWTLMVYLNDTKKGGGTRFTAIDQTFYPKKGKALAWNNLYPNGGVNPNTMHWGMPIEEGEKTIITKWFRERGDGPMFI